MENQIPQIEEEILKILLVDSRFSAKIFNQLQASDFSSEKNKCLFQTLKNLFNKNIKTDVVVALNEIKEKKLETIINLEFVCNLFSSYTTSAYLDSYIFLLQEKSGKKSLKELGEEIKNFSNNENESCESLIFKATNKLQKLYASKIKSKIKKIKNVFCEVKEKIKKLESKEIAFSGLPTGITEFDNAINGLQPGELIVLAARPGQGKTAFALNILINAAEKLNDNECAIMFSLEMSASQLVNRILSSLSQISQSDLRVGNIQNRWNIIEEVNTQINKMNILIDDCPTTNILDIYEKLYELKINNELPKLVIVDYLQLVNSTLFANEKMENRQQEVAKISRLLKSYAREFNIPFVVLAQLNRESTKRASNRPILADLRESGAIEQDADVVVFVVPPVFVPLNDKENNLLIQKTIVPCKGELIMAKNRNGIVKDIPVFIDMSTSTFANWK